MEIFNLMNAKPSERLLKNAILACESAKTRNDYPTANKYFAVALVTQQESLKGFLFLEGKMDYYGLLHVAVNDESGTLSVCCPIPMLNEKFVDISAQLPQVERKVHNRVFDFESPEIHVEEVQDYLDDFYHEVFRTAAEPCWYLKYKVEDSYPNNSFSNDSYDDDIL